MSAIERESLEEVMRNLNKEIKAIKGRTMKGYIRAARLVRRDMDRTPPLIPVGDTGNLRDSWFTQPAYRGTTPILFLGFGAEYAIYVHENYGANFRRPNAGAGFFVAAINRNKERILEILMEETKVK